MTGRSPTRRLCGPCGREISPGTEIAAFRKHWGQARCVGIMRPDVRSWLEERACGRPAAEIAMGYDDEGVRRYKPEAEAAIRDLVDPRTPTPRVGARDSAGIIRPDPR